MIFSTLEITNFRSIGDPGVRIEFQQNLNLYALIGANNAGKSNILDALALVVGIRNSKFYNYRIVPTDFYNQDPSKTITIKLTLRDPLPYRDVYQQACFINGFIFTAKELKAGENKGEVKVDHYCFGKDSKGKDQSPLTDSPKMYKAKKESSEDIENKRIPLWARDHNYKLGSYYFLDIQNLDTFFSPAGLGPLGRLFKIYKDDFQNPNTKYKFQNSSGPLEMPSKKAFEKAAERVTDILRTDKLGEIELSLSNNISTYLGTEGRGGASISLGLPDPQELFEELTVLRLQESKQLKPIDISKLGSGYLSLFRLAALRSLAEMQESERGIYLIEEPEIYLHPHLRKFFYKTLNLLASKGNQIIFSTHSEDFVSLSTYKAIIRVQKENDSTVAYQVPSNMTLDFDHVDLKVKAKGNGEVYFARKAVLTEGQDDKAALIEALSKKGVEYDSSSVSVIDCESKGQIPDYIRLLNAVHVQCFALFDTDLHGGTSKETNAIVSELSKDKTRYHAMPDTLETALKTTKKSPNTQHLLSILEPLDFPAIKNQFPDFSAAVEACEAWISK